MADYDLLTLNTVTPQAEVSQGSNRAVANDELVLEKDLVITEAADHTSTPTAGYGYLWSRSDTPNVLIFTDDAGTDFVLSGDEIIGSIAFGDETTDMVAATEVATFHMPPWATVLTDVIVGMTTAPTGSTAIFDLNEAGSTVLSTKVSVDIGEKTSATAATPPVVSDSALAANALMEVDIDQAGSTVAGTGGKIYLIGRKA